jgi:hypothetical protein
MRKRRDVTEVTYNYPGDSATIDRVDDMDFDEADEAKFNDDPALNKFRAALKSSSAKWPNGVVDYYIQDPRRYSSKEISYIREHLDKLSQATNRCVKFNYHTSKPRSSQFIGIVRGSGCSSAIGSRRGGQTLSLGSGCINARTVPHEFTHALGFYHEQSRSDRDRYLIIYKQNLNQMGCSNYAKCGFQCTDQHSRFDYDSMMMYADGFFNCKSGLKTLYNKQTNKPIPYNNKPSKTDIEKIMSLYGCNTRGSRYSQVYK